MYFRNKAGTTVAILEVWIIAVAKGIAQSYNKYFERSGGFISFETMLDKEKFVFAVLTKKETQHDEQMWFDYGMHSQSQATAILVVLFDKYTKELSDILLCSIPRVILE